MPTICRFAVESSYYRPSNNTVRAKAFLPKDGTTSVFRLGDLAHYARIVHGNEHVGTPRGKSVLGYAEVASTRVDEHGLALIVDEPPPLHWNISEWPEDEDRQKLLALDLATLATFVPA